MMLQGLKIDLVFSNNETQTLLVSLAFFTNEPDRIFSVLLLKLDEIKPITLAIILIEKVDALRLIPARSHTVEALALAFTGVVAGTFPTTIASFVEHA